MNERLEAAVGLLADENFNEEAKGICIIEDFRKLFAKYRVELTAEEVEGLCKTIVTTDCKDELGESELSNAAGGISLVGAMAFGGAVIATAKYIVSRIKSSNSTGGFSGGGGGHGF